MFLSSTSEQIECYIDSLYTTSPVELVVSYQDTSIDGSVLDCNTEGNQITDTNPVIIVSAPSANKVRELGFISIYNQDTVEHSVVLIKDIGGVDTEITRLVLGSLETFIWTPKKGWSKLKGTGTTCDVQSFLTPGLYTWTKPTNMIPEIVVPILVGGGGGGGSGQWNTSGNVRGGGAGGGGGAYCSLEIPAVFLKDKELVAVGSGGLGGSVRTSVGNGFNGLTGEPTIFGGHQNLSLGLASEIDGLLIAGGGGGGTAGSVAITIGGFGGSVNSLTPQSTGQGFFGSTGSSITPATSEYGGGGGAGHSSSGGAGNAGGSSIFGGGGGGSGGSVTSLNNEVAAAEGGSSGIPGGGGGGSAGTVGGGGNGGPGGNGSDGSSLRCGHGGGGGGASASGTGGVGGNGGWPGGGGGGGGGGTTGAGTGGSGGGGAAWIITIGRMLE